MLVHVTQDSVENGKRETSTESCFSRIWTFWIRFLNLKLSTVSTHHLIIFTCGCSSKYKKNTCKESAF